MRLGNWLPLTLQSLFFSLFVFFPMSLAFLCVFPFFSKDFRGSAKRKTLAFLGVSLKGWRVRVNTVLESTVSNAELIESFGPHRLPGRKLSEFLSPYYLWISQGFSPNSPSLPKTQWVLSSETVLAKQHSASFLETLFLVVTDFWASFENMEKESLLVLHWVRLIISCFSDLGLWLRSVSRRKP